MRGVWFLVSLSLCVCALASTSKAATFNVPLTGVIEILGDIPSPVTATFNLAVNPIPPVPPPANVPPVPGFSYDVVIEQSAQSNGGFFFPQTCIGTACGTFAGFGGCGLQIGCGFLLPAGFVMSRGDGNNPPVPVTVDDANRFFGISGGVAAQGGVLLDVQFTLDLPDGLRVAQLATTFSVTPTPLPATLPLFAAGVAGLALLSCRKKRRT